VAAEAAAAVAAAAAATVRGLIRDHDPDLDPALEEPTRRTTGAVTVAAALPPVVARMTAPLQMTHRHAATPPTMAEMVEEIPGNPRIAIELALVWESRLRRHVDFHGHADAAPATEFVMFSQWPECI